MRVIVSERAIVLGLLLGVCVCIFPGCGSNKKSPVDSRSPVSYKPEFTAEEMGQAVREAARFIAARDYKRVVETLDKYKGCAAAPVRLFEYLGEAYLYLTDFRKSESALAEGLRRDLYSARIRELLSSLNYVQGRLALEKYRYSDAREFFKKAILNTPKDQNLINNIAGLYRAEGKRLEALKNWKSCAAVLRDARDLDIGLPSNDFVLARALFEIEEPQDALAAIERYLDGSGGDVAALVLKGDILNKLGREPEALGAWRSALRKDPDNYEIKTRIGALEKTARNIHVIKGQEAIDGAQWDLAAQEFEEALKAVTRPGPEQQLIYERLAFIYASTNDYTKALDYYGKALATEPDNIPINLAMAKVLRLSKRFAEARNRLDGLLSKYPENLDVRLAMADFYVRTKTAGNAIPHLERVIATEGVPKDRLVQALDLLGWCYAKRGRLEKAEEAWLTLLRHDPNNAKTLSNLGLVFLKQHRIGDAIEYYEKACQVASTDDPSFSKWLHQLSLAFRQNGQNDHYKSTLEKLVMFCPLNDPYRREAAKLLESMETGALKRPGKTPVPGSPEAMLADADGFAHAGELEKALGAYEKLLSIEPPPRAEISAAALRGIGIIHLTEHEYDQAVVDFTRSLDLVEGDREALLHLGDAFEKLGLPGEAVKVYRKIRSRGKDQLVRFQLARALRAGGSYEAAVMNFDMVLNRGADTLIGWQAQKMLRETVPLLLSSDSQEKSDGQDRRRARSLRRLALAFSRAGLRDRARSYLDRARKLGGENAETMMGEAMFLEQEGRSDQAMAVLFRAADQNPRDGRVLLQLAVLLFKKGRTGQAEKMFLKVLDIDSTNVEAACSLVDIYQAAGRIDEGRKLLRDLLRKGIRGKAAQRLRRRLRLLG